MNAKIRSRLPNSLVLTADIVITVVAITAAFAIRLAGDTVTDYIGSLYWMILISLLIKPAIYYFFGLYRRLWAYASINELTLISAAVTVASAVFSAVMLILFIIRINDARVINFPRTILLIDWLLSLVGIGGLRFSIRLLAEGRSASKKPAAKRASNVLIIGAGDAGALVVRELQRNPQLGLHPIGYLDDDLAKQRHQIHGVPVVGRLSDLRRTLEHRSVSEVIISIPSAGGKVVRQVTDVCRLKGIPFRTMPGLFELIGGKVSVNRLREVDITDLLRREPVQIQDQLVGATMTGKRVLVTGAGGSIGREICRQIAHWGPQMLILLGHGENSIFEAMLELREDFPSLPMQLIIADIRDKSRIHSIFTDLRPQVVFHAAAHKHVPLMESNIEEAITNNIIGTRNIVQAASAVDTELLVLISTDKAVRPANIMGATKRIAEMIVLEAAHRTGHAYSVVRFGNVLGSRGSVVPLFKRQIAHGGPVTVTHPDMKRYFMTIPEAVHLVLQTAVMGQGGEVFMLNMGQQVRILDLAEDLIRLSGLEPGKDIEIVFTGIRPGEKLSEDLWGDGMQYQKTSHPEIFRAEAEEAILPHDLDKIVDELNHLAHEGEVTTIIHLLDETIPDGKIRVTPPADLTSLV
ncbi:MAG TPA: nucleoside-diphosphate sugar epimerase/dehydratase [Anaerolineales bacterium]|nr:nucleoside-diphosphate sugar epimerase/dehydratase [Anaerolineales bacterium]